MKRLDEIFDLRYGHSLELNRLTQVQAPEGVNFASRAMGNNGITARVLTDAIPGRPGEITVALGGNGVLSSFVQPEPFVCGRDVMILTPKDPDMTLEVKLWYCVCIWENRYRYSYGRQANRTLGSLLVPDEPSAWVTTKQVPSHRGLQRSLSPRLKLTDAVGWADFPLNDIFELKKGKRVTKAHRKPGDTRFISATDSNNGISDWINLAPIFPENSITVPYDGSIGYAFFQPEPYFALDSVNALIPRHSISVWQGLYLVAAIRFEKWRFSYGYKWNLTRMKKTTIRLPVTSLGDPDWDYMERFMKGLPFSAALAGEVV